MGVGDCLKESMDNWGKQKPAEQNVPLNPPADGMELNQRPTEAEMEKNFLSSIDAEETVGKMKETLPEFTRLLNEPPVPGNEVLDEEMNKKVNDEVDAKSDDKGDAVPMKEVKIEKKEVKEKRKYTKPAVEATETTEPTKPTETTEIPSGSDGGW